MLCSTLLAAHLFQTHRLSSPVKPGSLWHMGHVTSPWAWVSSCEVREGDMVTLGPFDADIRRQRGWPHNTGASWLGLCPQCVGGPQEKGRSLVARTHLTIGGHGRPACCTAASTSAEQPSSMPSGWSQLPTASKSESSHRGSAAGGGEHKMT